MSQVAMPPALEQVALLDPELHDTLVEDFTRLAQVATALTWAQTQVPRLAEASDPNEVLAGLVEQARELTEAPVAWALLWRGDVGKGRASFEAVAGDTAAVPSIGEISESVVAEVARSKKPVWSDDAQTDARFLAAESVQAFALRSIACLPVGANGVLYLADPDAPGRFAVDMRLKLSALARLGGAFLRAPSQPGRAPVQGLPGIVGSTQVMGVLFDQIRAFAPMPWAALILGESGTGKESVARALHQLSARASQPFVPVNCGAIPGELAESLLFGHERGAFTGADRRQIGVVERVGAGTLFLDEIGDLPASLQVKLLRLLQEGTFERVGGDRTLRFSGRVVAATHRALDDAAGRGTFREDLYYRLASCILRVPTLDARRADIPSLAVHLLERNLAELPGTQAISLSEVTGRVLAARSWPGNVRELANVLRTAIAQVMAEGASCIEPRHVEGFQRGGSAQESGSLAEQTTHFQKRVVNEVLERCAGNRSKAARELGVSRQWLHRLLARWESE